MRSDIATTGLVAVVVMAVILLLVLRARWRLLSLAVTAVGITWGFAVVGYLGGLSERFGHWYPWSMSVQTMAP